MMTTSPPSPRSAVVYCLALGAWLLWSGEPEPRALAPREVTA